MTGAILHQFSDAKEVDIRRWITEKLNNAAKSMKPTVPHKALETGAFCDNIKSPDEADA